MKLSVRYLAEAAVIAALYAVLVLTLAPLSSGPVQVRISEALTILPALYGSAVPGLFLGCLVANLFTGNVFDIVFGSLITLAAAILGRLLAKKAGKAAPFLAPLPAVILNALFLPFVFVYGYGLTSFGNATSTPAVLGFMSLSVLAGETLSAYVLGLPLYFAVRKLKSATK